MENAQNIDTTLSDQVSLIKDLLFLDKSQNKLDEYTKLKQKLSRLLDEVEILQPENQEIKLIRRRYDSLDHIAVAIGRSHSGTNNQATPDIKGDFRAINSFDKDISLYTRKLVENFKQEYIKAMEAGEKLNQVEEVVKWGVVVFTLIMLVGQLGLILLPTIRSIQKLQAGAAAIGEGNLDYRLNIHTGDEIEQLSQEFNAMTIRLGEFYRNLEAKVLERTVELSTVNQSLEKEILERRQAEIELQSTLQDLQETQIQKATADAASVAKSEFLANMSHELRTPLNGILGYVQIMQRDKEITPQQLKGINVIQQCSHHLLNLITDILDLSKIEAQKMELHFNDFHFLDFLKSVVDICAVRAEQKGIAFNYQPSAALPIGVRTDEKRLRQVLINLLGNAIKFTEKGGVTLAVDVIPRELEDEQKNSLAENGQNPNSLANSPGDTAYSIHRICFRIVDTGVGMSSEQIEKIFLPFEQVGNSKVKLEGTGLGLAISQKIVQLMGSTIDAESQLGQGSTFWLNLDLLESPGWADSNKRVIQQKVTDYVGKRRKVLILDDKWENRSILINLLGGIGFQTAEALNGEEGLEKVRSFSPDFIITDLVMPVMDGFEMVRQIRRSPEFDHIIIIISSASVFGEDRQQSINAGANDFLAKPIQFDELLTKLQKLLDLEWIYEVPQKLTQVQSLDRLGDNSSSVTPPPAEIIDRLYDLAMKGNINGIIGELDLLNDKFSAFTSDLRDLADNFQVKKIKEFIKLYRENK